MIVGFCADSSVRYANILILKIIFLIFFYFNVFLK
jgi:hypothetical protein